MDQYGNVVPVVRGVPNLGLPAVVPLVDLERFDNSRYYRDSAVYDSNNVLPRAFGSDLTASAGLFADEAPVDVHHIDARTANLSYGGIAPPQN